MEIGGVNLSATFKPGRSIACSWFGAVICISLTFALYTNHAWEDWFITYRASKNLALGNGLVFNVGERVHTFTSPINVLLPALLNYLTQNTSDQLVIWLYRVVSALFLGATSWLLIRISAGLKVRNLTAVFMLALFATDAKIIDFSINGQEAAFWVFFAALMLYGLCVDRLNSFWIMGVSWAGLMWSRPDSVVLIAAFALATFGFRSLTPGARQIPILLRFFLRSGLVVLLLYGPWTIWTYYYYGTVVPHTIEAKGQWQSSYGQLELVIRFLFFPIASLFGQSSLGGTFMPSYALVYGGWPQFFALLSKGIAWLAAVYWLLPVKRTEIRIISFTLMCAQYYLSYITPFTYPWYYPASILLSIVVLGIAAEDAFAFFKLDAGNSSFSRKHLLLLAIPLVLVSQAILTLLAAYQLRVQQVVIESGHRREIGLWLREHAGNSKDTLFLECLGYIGFFSGLKTYDYPGMSSPEMVLARRLLATERWDELIISLKPDWLVLRPGEAHGLSQSPSGVLAEHYLLAARFDAGDRLKKYSWLPGRAYLEYDQTFYVFKRI